MLPFVVLGVVEQALRLVNNIIEGKPPELRKAEALAAWAIFKPVIWPLLPDDVKVEIDKILGS